MQIKFRTKKLEKICSEYTYSVKTYGPEMAVKINMLLDQISAADSVEMLIAGRIGRCHPLTGNLKKIYAMDLVHPYRLEFEKTADSICTVRIITIEDYH